VFRAEPAHSTIRPSYAELNAARACERVIVIEFFDTVAVFGVDQVEPRLRVGKKTIDRKAYNTFISWIDVEKLLRRRVVHPDDVPDVLGYALEKRCPRGRRLV
jgi:chemotaxis signal transduction protein